MSKKRYHILCHIVSCKHDNLLKAYEIKYSEQSRMHIPPISPLSLLHPVRGFVLALLIPLSKRFQWFISNQCSWLLIRGHTHSHWHNHLIIKPLIALLNCAYSPYQALVPKGENDSFISRD